MNSLQEFEIKKRGDKWFVVGHKGNIKGSHSNRKQAEDQIAAIYASGYKEKKAMKNERYLEEEGQPELFDTDTMLQHVEAPKEVLEALRKDGEILASRMADRIFTTAEQILLDKVKAMDYEGDLEIFENNDIDNMDVADTDAFFELVGDLCHAYLEGMNSSWPYPILNE